MPAEMPIELNMLIWSVALCVLQMLISVITAQGQVGLPPLIGNREGFPELKGLAGRASRAYGNMVANLVLFASLALVVVVSGHANAMTALGAQLFFWARLGYAIVYLIGIPWARTGLWAISIVGLVLMFAALPWLSPKPFAVDTFRTTYWFIALVVMAAMAFIHAGNEPVG